MSNSSPEKVTVLLADDHLLMQQGIRSSLSQYPDMEIVGEASNGIDVQYMVTMLHPQVILLDLRMPDLPPALFTKWVREFHPETAVLVLTFHINNVSYLAGMMEAGASGYLSKSISGIELANAIRRAVHGEMIFDDGQLTLVNWWQENINRKLKRLTHQEMAVAKLLMRGRANQFIANKLEISEKTITFHLTSIYEKLEVHSRVEAILWITDHLIDNLDFNPYLLGILEL